MKGVQDRGSIPLASTKSILNGTPDRRRLKVDWSPPVNWRSRVLLMGATRFRLGIK